MNTTNSTDLSEDKTESARQKAGDWPPEPWHCQ